MENDELCDTQKLNINLDIGSCMGDYGIITQTASKYSLFTSEDTYIITIDSIFFQEILSRLISKGENERKLFFKLKLDIFRESYKFDEYYKRISIIVIILIFK